MSTGPGVCPNCGAPWQLDESGNCSWCHARVRAEAPAARYHGYSAGLALVPGDVDDCGTSAPFIFLALSVLGPELSLEPVVQEYLRGNPGLVREI